MLRVVFDTVVFVRCLINPFGLWGKLVFERAREYRLVLSRPVIEEIVAVLARPELAAKFRTLAGLDLRAVLDLLAQAEIVELDAVPAASRDPKDDKFLATAVAAADYLVTEDQDLLVLKEHAGTKIVPAATFLHLLEAKRTS
jgi:putative PIN family toxin of toxin-antitoxin system